MEAAKKHMLSVREMLDKDSAANRESTEGFYRNLALFSGGTFSLSITYLGYLNSTRGLIDHLPLLITSWCCFVASIPLSLFYSVLYANYVAYARWREYCAAKADHLMAEADAVSALGAADLTTEQVQKQVEILRTDATNLNKESKRCSRNERIYSVLWRWGGFVAKGLFIAGLSFLFAFATFNALRAVPKRPCTQSTSIPQTLSPALGPH
jgi:hypothetical protein